MNLKIPLEKTGLKSLLKGKVAKIWILLFLGLIAFMSVLCGTVYVAYTVGSYDLAHDQLELSKQQLKSMDESRKLAERKMAIMKANEGGFFCVDFWAIFG
jgi:hypothetical protein